MTGNKRSWLRRKMPEMPTRDEMARNRWLAPIADRFGRSELWRFTRRSVPRGVALGVFAGFIIPVGQIFLAAFLALPARANVPLAALVTFITNPFTFPFWAFVANRLGSIMLRIDPSTATHATDELSSGRWSWLVEMFEGAGVTVMVTVFGFIVLALAGCVVSYFITKVAWRMIVARKWARRPARRQRSLAPAE